VSLHDKLKPDNRTPVGKVGPCEKCGFPDCEYVLPRYQKCDRCAGKIKQTYEAPPDLWDDFDDDPPTNPGFSMSVGSGTTWTLPPTAKPHKVQYTIFAWYQCATCQLQSKMPIDDVANGATCLCGGHLRLMP
jgi:hypothetical protein